MAVEQAASAATAVEGNFFFYFHFPCLVFGKIFLTMQEEESIFFSGLSQNSCFCRCKMYPDFSYAEKTTSETLIMGVAPEKP